MNFIEISNFLNKNINTIYYTLGVLATFYGFFIFLKKIFLKTDFYNLLRLIKETPELVVEIRKGQNEIYKEIKLQGKLVNSILDTLELAQFVCDSEGKCIKVNPKWTSITGLSESEAHGHNWLLSVHIDDRQSVQKKWHNMIAYNTPFEEIFRYQHRVTEVITKVKCTALDVEDEDGKRIFILGLSRIL
jgi:PAS domain S-box-containing protein